MASARRNALLVVNSRMVLVVGFGGLLLLMAFAGFDGIQLLQHIKASSDDIRDDFLLRTRVLERIRADLYVSGTYVRDYLLEPESGKAERHRNSLLETRSDMDSALEEYRRLLLNAQESKPFQVLTQELTAYWRVLEPVFQWSTEQRQRGGYIFLRDEVFPRRMSMLGIADQIGAINESQLNAGKAKVEETFRRFRRRLTVTTGLTIGLGVLLASFSVRKMLGLETRTAQHYEEILNTKAELKQLSARLVEAQEDERRSISRELHDEVGQALTGMLVEMANLSSLIRAKDVNAPSKADEIKRLIENSITVVRNMALLLRPSMLDDLGLVPALQWQAREVSKRSGVWVKVAADHVSEELPEDHKTCVYRIVQEALHNIVQHAAARNVRITVRQEEDRLLLHIQDDGKGFNPQQEKGMGLLGIQERVSCLGGSFGIDSDPGEGTVLRVVLLLPDTIFEKVQEMT